MEVEQCEVYVKHWRVVVHDNVIVYHDAPVADLYIGEVYRAGFGRVALLSAWEETYAAEAAECHAVLLGHISGSVVVEEIHGTVSGYVNVGDGVEAAILTFHE